MQFNLTTLLAAGGHHVSVRAVVAGRCAAREGLSMVDLCIAAPQAVAMPLSTCAGKANSVFGNAMGAEGVAQYETKHPGHPPLVGGDTLH
ncbi:MAG: hypothetical protein JO142_13890 [Burkholderiales bacterium]|nr:hypothetical protein [Burkholderiales bacterium]